MPHSLSICRRLALALLALALALSAAVVPAGAVSRIKDIVDFEGVRDNMLVGYGLVVGLNGTGDSLNNAIFTRESLIGMLERMGVNARDNSLRTKNVAAVMVTATLPAFARQGGRIDQDGLRFGNFTGVSIDQNGIVTASFDNGQRQPIFIIPIATFPNPNGLAPQTGNTYLQTDRSGAFLLRQSGTGAAGRVAPSSLESSTVDIATEFSNLIITQRAYSANAKIITTADQMLQELIDSKR